MYSYRPIIAHTRKLYKIYYHNIFTQCPSVTFTIISVLPYIYKHNMCVNVNTYIYVHVGNCIVYSVHTIPSNNNITLKMIIIIKTKEEKKNGLKVALSISHLTFIIITMPMWPKSKSVS